MQIINETSYESVEFITSQDLVSIGFSPTEAKNVIRVAKHILARRGHLYYENRKANRIPKQVIQEVIGFAIKPSN